MENISTPGEQIICEIGCAGIVLPRLSTFQQSSQFVLRGRIQALLKLHTSLKAHGQIFPSIQSLAQRSTMQSAALLGWTSGMLKNQTPSNKHCLKFTLLLCLKLDLMISRIIS